MYWHISYVIWNLMKTAGKFWKDTEEFDGKLWKNAESVYGKKGELPKDSWKV